MSGSARRAGRARYPRGGFAPAAFFAATVLGGCAEDETACRAPTEWLCPRCSDPLALTGEGRRVEGRLEAGGVRTHTFRLGQLDPSPSPSALRLEARVEAMPDVFDGAVGLTVRSDELGLYDGATAARPLGARSAWMTGLRAWPGTCQDRPCAFPVGVELRNALPDRPVDYALSFAVIVEACTGAEPVITLDRAE